MIKITNVFAIVIFEMFQFRGNKPKTNSMEFDILSEKFMARREIGPTDLCDKCPYLFIIFKKVFHVPFATGGNKRTSKSKREKKKKNCTV